MNQSADDSKKNVVFILLIHTQPNQCTIQTWSKQEIYSKIILINGVSLTISKITKNGFEVWIIPHTYKQTNMSKLKKNSLANIEIDILSKYVKKYFYELH